MKLSWLTGIKFGRYVKENPTHVVWLGECPCGCGKYSLDTVRYGKVNLSERGYRMLQRLI